MTKNTVIAVVIAGVLVLGGGAAVLKKQSDDNKVSEKAAMMKKDVETTAMKSEDEAMMKKDTESMVKSETTMAKDDSTMMKKESGYITLAEYNANKDTYNNSKKVLFFAATWCPSCQALTKDIQANLSSIPADTVVIRADYDDEKDLKKTYGVTYQHTLVQIDNDGKQITKWNGGNTLESLVSKTI